jgi:hypothetical protein
LEKSTGYFLNSGKAISNGSDPETDAYLFWFASGSEMKLEHGRERNAVRWQKAREYGLNASTKTVLKVPAIVFPRLRVPVWLDSGHHLGTLNNVLLASH